MELSALLEPGKPPKTDKSAILVDAVRVVTQLRCEAQKLKDSNLNLQEKIKELKVKIHPSFWFWMKHFVIIISTLNSKPSSLVRSSMMKEKSIFVSSTRLN